MQLGDPGRLSALAQTIPFRLAAALLFLALHVGLFVEFAGSRYQQPMLERGLPAPHYVAPAFEWVPRAWNRLVFSRWDSAHYISLSLRGYQNCPPEDLRGIDPLPARCNFNYYPGYPALGRLVSAATGLAADYSLLALSLAASFVLLFLWTSPTIVGRLGVWRTYLSLLLFNLFPTAFLLVTISTEPCVLAFTLAAFVALARRRWVLAGLLAGAASGMRISGLATGAALALALLVTLSTDRPRRPREWSARLGGIALSGWGALAIMAFHYYRYHDPLLYIHSHAQVFKHSGSPLALFSATRTQWFLRSIDHPLHEGVVVAFALVWFLLGHRRVMSGFGLFERVFWYSLAVFGFGISFFGSLDLNLAWMSRYILIVLPLFFAMAAVLARRPALLVLWLVMSSWHYRQVDLCDYLGGVGDARFTRCLVPQWIGHW